MNIEFLKQELHSEPRYRFTQAWKAIFQDLISDWKKNTNLPLALREKLNDVSPLTIDAEIFEAKDSKTVKALITLQDNAKIEAVLMRHKDGRATVCVSSQVGCALRCTFCATGTLGRTRDLTVDEILIQVLLFARYLKDNDKKHPRVTNIVCMGMGEPFLNYDNVMNALKIMNDPDGLNIGARHISVSTSGIIPGIERFAQEKEQFNLAVSLHAPNEKLRGELMPINRKYPLTQLMKAVADYVDNKSRQVMFEYVMIAGVNDKPEYADELASLMTHPLYVVNLIRYNPTGKFKPSEAGAITKFKNLLLRKGIKVTQRHSFGQDIDAACGQLAKKSRD